MATYRREAERMDFNTERGHVLLLEFASQMTLDEGRLLQRRYSQSWSRSGSLCPPEREGRAGSDKDVASQK